MPYPERIEYPATQVVDSLSDDFAALNLDRWQVVSANSPTVASSIMDIVNGVEVRSNKSFQPPCLVEAVVTMNARVASDNFAIGLFRDDNNRVEWRFVGSTATNMDINLVAGGVADNMTGINVGAANNTYRYVSIYVGMGEIVWSTRAINSTTSRAEPHRIIEHTIPEGPFRIRFFGQAGTSTMRVHRVRAYQLCDTIPTAALGHVLDMFAAPVRLTNTPFIATPSSHNIASVAVAAETFSSLAGSTTSTGTTRNFFLEQAHIQCYAAGGQTFSVWLEAQVDGTNWQVVWYSTSVDSTSEGVTRYYASSPTFQLNGSRNIRIKLRNTSGTQDTFRAQIVATPL